MLTCFQSAKPNQLRIITILDSIRYNKYIGYILYNTHKRVCSPAFASLPQATSRPQLKIRVDSFWKTRPDYLRLFNSAAEQCFVQCRRYA